MEKEIVISTLQNIITKSGLDNILSISEDAGEISDFMIINEDGLGEYLALFMEPLFPIRAVRSIYYQYGKDRGGYLYSNTILRIIFRFDDGDEFNLEYTDDGISEYIVFDNVMYKGIEVKAALKSLCMRLMENENMLNLLSNLKLSCARCAVYLASTVVRCGGRRLEK